MTDTQYTAGFRAGMAWREAEIIRLLEEADSACSDWAIAIVEGKDNVDKSLDQE